MTKLEMKDRIPYDSYSNYLHSRLKELENKKDALTKLLHQLKSNIHLKENFLTHIGAEIYIEKSPQEARRFVERQLRFNSEDIKRVSNEVSDVKLRVRASSQADSVSSPGDATPSTLPIVEIQERLDEYGNVIGAKLNDRPFFLPNDLAEPLSDDSSKHSGHGDKACAKLDTARISTDTMPHTENARNLEKNEVQVNDQIAELLYDMELKSPRSESITSPLEGTSEKRLNNEGFSTTTPDLYELEMMAGELDMQDEFSEEDGDFDYDFEDSEDDLLESGTQVDFLNKLDTTLLPGNRYLHDRLRDEITALRRQKKEDSSSSPINEGRQVRFKDTLEIKEIENVSSELSKISYDKSRLSRFKATRSSPDKIKAAVQMHQTTYDNLSRKEACPSDKTNDYDEHVVLDIVERAQSPRDIVGSFPVRDRSCTTEVTLDSTESFSIVPPPESTQGLETPEFPGDTAPDARIKGDASVILAKVMTESTTFGREKNSQNQMDTLVESYNNGDFDTDLTLSGPVVSKLDDFSILNKMIESMSTQDTRRISESAPSVYDQQSHIVHTSSETDSVSSESSDEAIMTDFITEREEESHNFSSSTENIHDLDEVEQYVIEREVSEQYYRLKEKLGQQEFPGTEGQETSDKGGLSRFKSRRMKA
ncbi:hypothetical protein OXX59_006787 [Metschnikowia pulcherrima]